MTATARGSVQPVSPLLQPDAAVVRVTSTATVSNPKASEPAHGLQGTVFGLRGPFPISKNVNKKMSSDSLPALTPSSVKLSRGSLTVVVNGDYPSWVRVNKTGSEILDYCDGMHTMNELVDSLSAKYGRPTEEVRKDVQAFLANAISKHLFDTEPPWKYTVHEAIDRQKPSIVVINVTNKCNLLCPYCYQSAGRAYKDELRSEEIVSVIKQALEINPEINISLSGGEPLMRKGITEIISFACSKARKVSLLTNGTLITAKVADELARVKSDRLFVQVSVDGANPLTHDSIRGEGSFERSMKGIRLLQENGIPVVLSYTVTKANSGQISEFLKLCDRLKVRLTRIDYVKAVGRAQGDGQSMCLTPQDYYDAVKTINHAQAEYGWRYGNPLNDRAILLGSFLKPRAICGAGVSIIFVDADGNVYPCTSLTSPECLGGNIRRDSMEWIVTRSEAFRRLRHFDINSVDECRTCYLKYICNGACWIDGYAAYNAPAPNPYCSSLKRLADEMILEFAQNPSRIPELAALKIAT